MKTPKEELERRKKEWETFKDTQMIPLETKAKELHDECLKLEKEKEKEFGRELNYTDDDELLESIWKPHTDLLESPEWEKYKNTLMLGPEYDLPLEDLLDPDFEFPWGSKINEDSVLKQVLLENPFGKIMMPRGYRNPCRVLGLSYDYGDYYWRLEDLIENKVISDTLVDGLNECEISKNDLYYWSSDPIWSEDQKTVWFKDKKYKMV